MRVHCVETDASTVIQPVRSRRHLADSINDEPLSDGGQRCELARERVNNANCEVAAERVAFGGGSANRLLLVWFRDWASCNRRPVGCLN